MSVFQNGENVHIMLLCSLLQLVTVIRSSLRYIYKIRTFIIARKGKDISVL